MTVPPLMAVHPSPDSGPSPGISLHAGVLPLPAVASAPGGPPATPLTGVHPLTAIVSASGSVLPPAGVPPFAAGSLPVGVPTPAGVPPLAGVPTGVPPTAGIPPPAGVPTGVPPLAGVPTGVPPPAGVPPLAGVPPPAGIPPPAGGGVPPPASVPPLGGVPTGVPPLAGITPPARPAGIPPLPSVPTGVPPLAGIPPPASVPPLAGVPPPASVPPLAGVPPVAGVSTGVTPLAGVLPPAGVRAVVSACGTLPLSTNVPASSLGGAQLAGVPRPVAISMAAVVAPAAANSTLPPPRFFDPSVPPPPFIPSVLSSVVSSVTDVRAMPMSRATEDMDLENSGSSDEDLGEGFDEEWPICSRRTSSRSRISSQQPAVVCDQGLQLNVSQSSASGSHPSELHSMLEKLPMQSDEYFRMGIQQPHMYGTSLPVSGNNFAIVSLPPDCNNQLPSTMADMSAVSGPGLVKGQPVLLKPNDTPAVMDGSVNPASGYVSRGLSDVDFRTSSYGSSIVPVGPPPLSVPMKMVPPPLPPLASPLTSHRFPGADGCAGIGATGHNQLVPRLDTPHDMLAPRIGGIAHRGPAGMLSNPPPGLSGIRNVLRPPVSGTASVHGVVGGACDTGSRFISPLPSRTFEPAAVQPPSQQVFMQGSMNMNPSMMSAVTDIGPVRGHIPGGREVLGSGPVSSVNVQFPRIVGPDSRLPMNAGSLRCPTELGAVVRNMVPPDSAGFNVRHEVPRIRGSVPSFLEPGVINKDQHSVGPVSQIPRVPLPCQSVGVPVEQRTSLSGGPSERLLNALHSLAGMQTASLQDDPSHGTSTGITNPRFANSPIEGVDAGMQQNASGMKKSLFGLQADISGFGAPLQSLLPQQNRSDGVQSFGSLPAPPRFSSGQLCFPLSGNISTSVVIWFIHFQSAFIGVICPLSAVTLLTELKPVNNSQYFVTGEVGQLGNNFKCTVDQELVEDAEYVLSRCALT